MCENLVSTLTSGIKEISETLGSGFSKEIYYNALIVMLRDLKLIFENNFEIPIKFRKRQVGTVLVNLLVEKQVVILIGDKHDSNEDELIDQVKLHMRVLNVPDGIFVSFSEKLCVITPLKNI
jgi:GxxExxY protein